MGEQIGVEAYTFAQNYFNGTVLSAPLVEEQELLVYPNPVGSQGIITIANTKGRSVTLMDLNGKQLLNYDHMTRSDNELRLNISYLKSGIYLLKIGVEMKKIIVE